MDLTLDPPLEPEVQSPDFQSLFQDQSSTQQLVDEPEASSSFRSNSGSNKYLGLNGGSGHGEERQYSLPYNPESGSTLISSAVQFEQASRGKGMDDGQFHVLQQFYHDTPQPASRTIHRPPPLPMHNQAEQHFAPAQYLDYRGSSQWSPHPSPGLDSQQLPDNRQLYQNNLSPGDQYVFTHSGAPSTNGAYTPSYAGSAFGDDFSHLIFDDADDSFQNLNQQEYLPSDMDDAASVYAFSNHGDVGSRRGSHFEGSNEEFRTLAAGLGSQGEPDIDQQ